MKDKSSEKISTGYSANDKILSFEKPLVMAIVNLTPDSFYDGGKFGHLKDVLLDVEEKIQQGADLIDIGASSSRPDATEIAEEEEWKRLEPVLRAIRKQFPETIISIDTFRSGIAQRSANLGADVINDISGGKLDTLMFETVAILQLPYIMMHMLGTPQTMQKNPVYKDVVGTIYSDFVSRIEILQKVGFEKIILDPGFGFGKTPEHNYTLLKHLRTFTNLGFPILTGLSRKNMINKIIGTNPVTALNGTTVLHTIALLNGASILRVHDVTEAKQAIELVAYYENV